MRQFLIDQKISGREISLFTGSTEDPFCNIYHEVLQQNISINGRHFAIAVKINGQELIFDNIHPEGISRIWDQIILFFSTDEYSALEQFFQLFDEFTQTEVVFEQQARLQESSVNTSLCK